VLQERYSMTDSTSDAERCIDGETHETLTDAHLAAALRGHSGGVATTVERVVSGLDDDCVSETTVEAALTEAEELTALLRELAA
jgi:hypothetical protein